MENHQDNLWSLSAQKYFRLEEPEIIKKIIIEFLPVGHKKIRSIRLICVRPFFVPNYLNSPIMVRFAFKK